MVVVSFCHPLTRRMYSFNSRAFSSPSIFDLHSTITPLSLSSSSINRLTFRFRFRFLTFFDCGFAGT